MYRLATLTYRPNLPHNAARACTVAAWAWQDHQKGELAVGIVCLRIAWSRSGSREPGKSPWCEGRPFLPLAKTQSINELFLSRSRFVHRCALPHRTTPTHPPSLPRPPR